MTKISTTLAAVAFTAIAGALAVSPAGAQGLTHQSHGGQTGLQAPASRSISAPTDIRDFRFVNTSNAVIQAAWISLAKPRAPWVRIDLSSPIGPNGTREIGMAGWRGAQCFFDVKVAFDDGRTVFWNNVNLCRVTNLST